MSTVETFRSAVEARKIDAIMATFADDISLYSPVKFTPFEGKPMVGGLFTVLLRTFEDFRYVGQLAGEVESSHDDQVAEAHTLIFRATVQGKQIHGMDLVHLDGEGQIKEFTVMVRPMSALQALSDAVLSGLVADGVVPAPQ